MDIFNCLSYLSSLRPFKNTEQRFFWSLSLSRLSVLSFHDADNDSIRVLSKFLFFLGSLPGSSFFAQTLCVGGVWLSVLMFSTSARASKLISSMLTAIRSPWLAWPPQTLCQAATGRCPPGHPKGLQSKQDWIIFSSSSKPMLSYLFPTFTHSPTLLQPFHLSKYQSSIELPLFFIHVSWSHWGYHHL